MSGKTTQKKERQKTARQMVATLIFAMAALIFGGGCMEQCGSIFNKSADARAYMAQKTVEDFFESIIQRKRNDADYICPTTALQTHIKWISEYHILKINYGDQGPKESLTDWFSYKVLTRTTNSYGGTVSDMYMVYVKLMPDQSYKIFGILPENEAPFWERVNKNIDNADPCGFPQH